MSKSVQELQADLDAAKEEERKAADAKREREQQVSVLRRKQEDLRRQAAGEIDGAKLMDSRAEQRRKNSEALLAQAARFDASIQALESA